MCVCESTGVGHWNTCMCVINCGWVLEHTCTLVNPLWLGTNLTGGTKRQNVTIGAGTYPVVSPLQDKHVTSFMNQTILVMMSEKMMTTVNTLQNTEV